MECINLTEKFARIDALWTPKIVAELNGQHVKLAKVEGEFVWHQHDDADELFFVAQGCLTIHMRDTSVQVRAGEMFVVPRGVAHRPEAKTETHIVMFEPVGTTNTGNEVNQRTVAEPEWI